MDRLVETAQGPRGSNVGAARYANAGTIPPKSDQNPSDGRITFMMISIMAWHTIAAIKPFRQ